MRPIDRWITCLAALFCLDRLIKLAVVEHFFRQPPPPAPARWPTVTLLQPITRGAHGLEHNLACRLRQEYPAAVQHVFICDEQDAASMATCRSVCAAHPQAQTCLVTLAAARGGPATKVEKLLAGLPAATGEVLCFVDDDVAPRVDALRRIVTYLDGPQAGAAFGLACYTNWRNVGSSAMSAFVNANALLSYVPAAYLAEPFTITGHFFVIRRDVFERIGGLAGMDGRIDDDHELARRLRRHGLRCVQTPTIYDVDNDLPSLPAYLAQMQRWFVFPRRLMLPQLARRERAATALGGAGTFVPSLVAALALASRSRRAVGAFAIVLGVFLAVYRVCEWRYLGRVTPRRRLLLPIVAAVLAPLQVVVGLLAGDEVRWRGQRLRIGQGGQIEVLE
jgi:ceramide glucosyltransferase